jgi:hypothetical protein
VDRAACRGVFGEHAAERVRALQGSVDTIAGDFKDTSALFTRTCRFLGESPSLTPDELFAPLLDFLRLFEASKKRMVDSAARESLKAAADSRRSSTARVAKDRDRDGGDDAAAAAAGTMPASELREELSRVLGRRLAQQAAQRAVSEARPRGPQTHAVHVPVHVAGAADPLDPLDVIVDGVVDAGLAGGGVATADAAAEHSRRKPGTPTGAYLPRAPPPSTPKAADVSPSPRHGRGSVSVASPLARDTIVELCVESDSDSGCESQDGRAGSGSAGDSSRAASESPLPGPPPSPPPSDAAPWYWFQHVTQLSAAAATVANGAGPDTWTSSIASEDVPPDLVPQAAAVTREDAVRVAPQPLGNAADGAQGQSKARIKVSIARPLSRKFGDVTSTQQ